MVVIFLKSDSNLDRYAIQASTYPLVAKCFNDVQLFIV